MKFCIYIIRIYNIKDDEHKWCEFEILNHKYNEKKAMALAAAY